MDDAVALPGGAWTTAAAIDHDTGALRDALAAAHRDQPLLASLPIAEVRDRAGLDEARLAVALERLGDEVVVEARTIRDAGHSVELDDATRHATGAVADTLRAARFAPPPASDLGERAGLSRGDAQSALTFLSARGELREVQPGVYYLREILDEGIGLLAKVAASRDEFEPLEAKAVFGDISRKWLIPLLEYYDKLGATRRVGQRTGD